MPRKQSRLTLPLALLAGAGGLFAGRAGTSFLARPGPTADDREPADGRHKVVIVGAGFGGLQAAISLRHRQDIDLTVMDSQNHHLFQPLLYQVATAALSPDDIAAPIRGILPIGFNARVLMDQVTGVDIAARHVICGDQRLPYDTLVLATGSKPSYFGHEDWSDAAPGLKTLDDAVELRNRILEAFEKAAYEADPNERKRLLTFVLIGGGATGVEMAGSIAELAHSMLSRNYDLGGLRAHIVLIEAGPRLLAGFASDLSDNATKALASLGVEIQTNTRVTDIKGDRVILENQTLVAETVIWTAGTEATPVAEWLDLKPGRGGRVPVDTRLRVQGHPEIHIIGDAALALDRDGKAFPALAPVAKQQGHYVAQAIMGGLDGWPAQAPFRYRDFGTLATIGRNKAVAEFGPVHLTGTLAWLTWAGAHIFFLIGFRNRVMVSMQWIFAYATRQRSNRLIIRGFRGPSSKIPSQA